MNKVYLYRIKGDRNQALGFLLIKNEKGWPLYVSACLERGYMNNASNISNVPEGTYDLVLELSNKFNRFLWELKGVPGRSECKIHAANYWNQLNGCISPGINIKDLNGDGYLDVTDSGKALDQFHSVMNGQTKTTITIKELDQNVVVPINFFPNWMKPLLN